MSRDNGDMSRPRPRSTHKLTSSPRV